MVPVALEVPGSPPVLLTNLVTAMLCGAPVRSQATVWPTAAVPQLATGGVPEPPAAWPNAGAGIATTAATARPIVSEARARLILDSPRLPKKSRSVAMPRLAEQVKHAA